MSDAVAIAEELLAQEPPHPLLPLPRIEQVLACLATPEMRQRLSDLLTLRRQKIAQAQSDPVRHELEPSFWHDADALIREQIQILILLGGNRSSKSRYCGKRVVQALLDHPGTFVLAVSEDETASIETQQKIIWHYIPPEIKALCHNKRDSQGVFYLNYNEANGFSERKLVLPLPDGYSGNPSKLIFATYGEKPTEYEGMEFGHPVDWTVSWWADENLTLAWLNMFRRRGKFRPGTGLWSYTPIHGITPTIKESVGKTAKTLVSKPAQLLPHRINVPNLPQGHMPYIQEAALPRAKVIYFHTELSPFGPGPNGSGKPYAESVAEDCAGRPEGYTMRIAYGYTTDVIGVCYPKFSGEVHVVPPEALPAEGTNVCYIDPAGDRNWFIIWARVAPGNPRRIYIYREWPDQRRYGEWAVPSERPMTADSHKGWDGEAGPAQLSQGWGIVNYKRLLLAEETVTDANDPDPHRRRLWTEKAEGRMMNEEGEQAPVMEAIRVRKVDPRAAANPQAAERGGVNIVTLFGNEQRNPKTNEVEGPRMLLVPAYTGRGIDDGLAHVNELLDYKATEPVCPVLNEPKLYVASTCKAVIWMFEHYTGRGGEAGGCKDPADLVRYLAQDDDLRHVAQGGKLRTGGNVRQKEE